MKTAKQYIKNPKFGTGDEPEFIPVGNTGIDAVKNRLLQVERQELNLTIKNSKNYSTLTEAIADVADDKYKFRGFVLTFNNGTEWVSKRYNGVDASGFTTEDNWVDVKAYVPKKLSEFSNDAGFVTKTVENLVNYYLKSEIYTKEEVNSLVGDLSEITLQAEDVLPGTGSPNVIYLIPSDSGDGTRDQYIYSGSEWKNIGNTAVKLANYLTSEKETDLSNILTDSEIHKLQKNGVTIYPATTTDAVVDAIAQKSLFDCIRRNEYNVSFFNYNQGIDGTSVYNSLYDAVTKVPSNYRRQGLIVSWESPSGFVRMKFIADTADYRWTDENSWSKEVDRDELTLYNVSADNSSFDFNTAIAKIPNRYRKCGITILYKDVSKGWVIITFIGNSTASSLYENENYWMVIKEEKGENKNPKILNTWIVEHSKNIDNTLYNRINSIKSTIIDFIVEYPEGRPSELNNRILCLRSVLNTGGTLKIAYYDSSNTLIDDYTIDITIGDINEGIKKITTQKIIGEKPIIITCIIDTDRLEGIDNTGSVIISSIQGQTAKIQISEKSVSLFDLSIFEESGETIDGLLLTHKKECVKNSFHAYRYVDVLPQTCNSNECAKKLGVFVPSSSTENTVTFSQEDAANFTTQLALVCKISDNNYLICQFSKADENNTLTKLYDYGKNIDLRNVNEYMSLHDTVGGGRGQHLSPWGYRAFAQIIAEQTKEKYHYFDNVIGGFTAISCNATLDYKDKKIVDFGGELLSEPYVNSLWRTGGNTGIPGATGNIANGAGMSNGGFNRLGLYWSTKAYSMVQAAKGAILSMPFNIGRKFKGFIKIGCCCPIEGDFDGTAKISVYSTTKSLLYQGNIPRFADNIYIDIDNYIDGIIIEFEILESKNTKITLGYVSIVELYTNNIKPIDTNSIVAILGSSNTQYPPASISYIDIVAGDPDNEVVTRPNSTTGDGYGYYPKQLARLTGATVDNWGKSGEKTTYGLELIHEIFSTKRYTHVILSLFGNDINAGDKIEDIISNIWELCEFIKGHGAVPIIITSYGTASSIQVASYSKLHDYLMMSISNELII